MAGQMITVELEQVNEYAVRVKNMTFTLGKQKPLAQCKKFSGLKMFGCLRDLPLASIFRPKRSRRIMEKVNMGSWGKLILKNLKFLKFVYRFCLNCIIDFEYKHLDIVCSYFFFVSNIVNLKMFLGKDLSGAAAAGFHD